jgi:hypothetical protein
MNFFSSLIAGGLDLNALQGVTIPAIPNATVGSIINLFVGKYLFPIAGFVLLGITIVGGYGYMVSYGDPKKIAAAQEKITYGVIGFIVVFSSYWLVKIIGRILDIQAIKDIFGA